jgi:hypothetical protein
MNTRLYCFKYFMQADSFTHKCLKKAETISKGNCYVARNFIPAGTCILSEYAAGSVRRSDFNNPCKLSDTASADDELYRLFSTSRDGKEPLATLLAMQLINKMREDHTLNEKFARLCFTNPYLPNKVKEGIHLCAKILRRVCHHRDRITCDTTDYEQLVLYKIMLNGFTITDDLLQPVGLGVFPLAARFNHSCIPNCTQSFISCDQTVRLFVYANRDILEGDELTIAYIDVGTSTSRRRQQLLSSYGFYCHCSRCSTTNDDGVVNAFKCQRRGCTRGYLSAVSWDICKYHLWLKNEFLLTKNESSALCCPWQENFTYQDSIDLACCNCNHTSKLSSLLKDFKSSSESYSRLCNGASGEEFDEAATKVHSLVYADHYAAVQMDMEYCTSLIFINNFEKATNICGRYLPHVERLYANSPLLSLQLLQLGKLLLYHGNAEGKEYIRRSIALVVRLYGSFHTLVKVAKSILEG